MGEIITAFTQKNCATNDKENNIGASNKKADVSQTPAFK